MADIIKEVSKNLGEAQKKQMKYADQKRKDEKFQVGDKVLLSTKNIKVDTQRYKPFRKLQPHFIGPYKVIE